MKACVLESIGKLIYKDVADTFPKEGEVLLKIKACGICSSDIQRVFKTGTYHFPTIPGHEFSGEVESVGKGISKSYIGRKAAVFPMIPCFQCENCRQEQYARCDHYNYFGSRCDGGFAEYISVPFWNLVFFQKMDFDTAALCEPGAVALHSVNAAGINGGDKVLIIGTGTIGILAALWAGKYTQDVTIAGRTKSKVEFVKNINRFKVIDSSNDVFSNLYDIVIDCVGTNEVLEYALNCVKKGGKLVLTGNPVSDILLEKNDYWKILRKEITLKGTWNSFYGKCDNDWENTICFLEEEQESVNKLITHRYTLADCDSAFAALVNPDELTVKVMFIAEG